MTLPIQTYKQIVDAQSASMQANSPVVLDTSAGSVIAALINSNAANSIWLQALATQLLAVTRLSTSSGIDVDTFIADFGFARSTGNAAFGSLTFSRSTATQPGIVPVGTLVSISTNPSLTYIVTLDTTNGYYNAAQNAYILPVNTASIIVPAQCQTTGTIGNAIIGAINTIVNASTTPFVTAVTNAAAFAGGINAWSDTQTKQEFILYIGGLSRATYQAIAYAVSSTPSPDGSVVARYNIVENFNTSGGQQLGFFYVVIDNGQGTTASTALVNAVSARVNLYRGLTIQYSVQAATFTAVAIVIWVKLIASPTETQTQITANITAALASYALGLSFNQPFLYSRISEVVYDCDANIASIPSSNPYTLNTAFIDLVGSNLGVFDQPTVTVNYL